MHASVIAPGSPHTQCHTFHLVMIKLTGACFNKNVCVVLIVYINFITSIHVYIAIYIYMYIQSHMYTYIQAASVLIYSLK